MKRVVLLTVILIGTMGINAQEYCSFNANNALELDAENGTALAAGTILGETESIIATTGAEGIYKPQFVTATVGGFEISGGLQGNNNPKDANGGIPSTTLAPPATGSFIVFQAKADGYLYVVIRASSNKAHTVFEDGNAVSYTFAATGDETTDLGAVYHFTLPYTVTNGQNAVQNAVEWAEQEYLKASDPEKYAAHWSEDESGYQTWNRIAIVGAGVIKFPVRKGSKYIVNNNGAKITSSGFYFDTAGDADVKVDGVCILESDQKLPPPLPLQNIIFSDNTVKTICIDYWDKDGDGELSTSEAAAVTDLGSVFKNNKEIKSFNELVYFTGITSIGGDAFSYCSNLTSITIPNSVTSIEGYAFFYCSGLTSVTIPNSVTKIDDKAFYNCSGLISLTVDAGNMKYDSRDNCNAIIETSSNILVKGCKNTIIPNSVTSIGSRAFAGCSGLTSLTIPESVTAIGDEAFESSGLTSLTIPESVTFIGQAAFYCSNLTSIAIPTSITSIGYSSFRYCRSLTSISIPNSVISIDTFAFSECSGLTSVTIPNSVTSIGYAAFRGCNSLTSVNIADLTFWYNIDFNNKESNPLCYAHHLYLNGEEVVELNIPEGVTSIGCYAFYGCSGLTSVTIPNSVTKLGNYAFDGCDNLESLIIPDHLTKRKIQVDKAGTLSTLIAGEQYVIEELTLTGEINGSDLSVIRDMAGKRTSIRSYGINSFDDFDDTDGRLSVLDMSDVKIVSGGQYLYLDGLDDGDSWIELAQDDVIPAGTFNGCKKLTSISVPSGLKNVGTDAFDGTPWYENQPEGLVYIGNILYKYKGDMPENYHITIKEGTIGIANSAFYGRSTLSSIDIPESVKYLGIDDITYFDGRCPFYRFLEGLACSDVFRECTSLTTIKIPNGVTSIGGHAFDGCSGLTSITIGSGIEDIRNYAFAYCSKLKDVYCFAENIPSTNAYAFVGSNIKYATLHVLKGCSDAYMAVEPWKSFENIVEMADAKVKLSKTKAVIEKGKTLTLKSKVYPTTLDQSVTWESSDPKIVKVTSTGKIGGLKVGTATITCTSKATGLKATCEVTVGYVKLNNTKVAIEKGKTLTLKAAVYPTTEDQSVTWKSSDPTIVKVTSAGKIGGVKVGTATITCTSKATGLSATCEVTVGYVKLNYTNVTIEKGKTLTLKSKVYPTTEDQSVTWKSSDPTIVKVTGTGKIGGMKVGTATITCTSTATGLSATCEVTVGYVKLSTSELTIQKGKIVTLKSKVYPTTEDQSVTWESSNPKIVKVTSTGKIGGMKVGTATITCTSKAMGLSATCVVTVTAASARSLDGEVTDIDDMEVDPAIVEPFDVYDLSGRKVLHQVTSLDGLPDGIYIVNGKKILKKK